MASVYLSLGSNLGNRFENLRKAKRLLTQNGITIISNSRLFETTPYGVREQPNFLNIAVRAATDKEPEELLRVIKQIERDMGRESTYRWGPRIIDIDILLYENLIYRSNTLTIPHPEIKKRDFFLIPLLDINALLTDPESGKHLRDFINQTENCITNSIKIDL